MVFYYLFSFLIFTWNTWNSIKKIRNTNGFPRAKLKFIAWILLDSR